jgi:hypothetical protein
MGGTKERAASMVEFAIAAPLLFVLVFGIIDFGWAFSQNLDLKHAAREGARLAAVNEADGATDDDRLDGLIALIRARSTELADDETEVFVAFADGPADGNTTAGDIGDSVIVCMRYPLRSVTGATDVFLPEQLTTKAVLRMEKIPNFSTGDGSAAPAWTGSTCTP